ncbi:MAG TPA: hypothetical protein VFV65_03545 [Gemmatimonadales bacterium]|nr:hypothetical protein [Gemmatimonadales bacterium]
MRLHNGSEILRGDLRLERRGARLTGTVVLESSDDPPVPISDGSIGPNGEFEFEAHAPGPMQFSGRADGQGLAGRVALDRGRVWQWTAQRVPEGGEFYAALPRFTATQLGIGQNRTELTLPGAWIAAADAQPGVAQRAGARLAAAGVDPIPADSVRAFGFLPALGLARREQVVAAMVSALTAIRAELPGKDQPRFDALFRPRGAWLVDLHQAALEQARRRIRNATWEAARPALAAADLMPATLPAGTAEVPFALYRLAAMRDRDSASFEAAWDRLPRGGAASAQVAQALLDGYRDAAPWQGQAVTMLLSAEWVTVDGRRSSPAQLVRAAWRNDTLAVPQVRPRYFGYPEAVPSVGVPGPAVSRLVVPENWTAEQWALNRGPAGLLAVLRQLDLAIGENTTLEADGPSRLTSVAREAASTPAGFLEPGDVILEDPGAPPLYALATAIHEWQHLLMERHRFALPDGGTLQDRDTGLDVVASDLYLAEGFAEWRSARILEPVVARLPIVAVGDLQKLLVLENDNPADPHILGLRMLLALAAATGADTAAALVLTHADAPARVAEAVPAWRDAAVSPRSFPSRGQRRLVPETRFTVEDGVGDVVGVRIRVLADPPPGR